MVLSLHGLKTVGSVLQLADKNKLHLLMISRNPLTKEASELLQRHSSELTYLQVKDIADLETKLTALIKERFTTDL